MGRKQDTFVSSFSVPKDKESIYDKFKRIVKREGHSASSVLVAFMEHYATTHGTGGANPQTTLELFADESYTAAPTVWTAKQWTEEMYMSNFSKPRLLKLKQDLEQALPIINRALERIPNKTKTEPRIIHRVCKTKPMTKQEAIEWINAFEEKIRQGKLIMGVNITERALKHYRELKTKYDLGELLV
jgi:hypothetical protein